MQFKNKITLITGAASGIGRAAALAFAKEGAIIVVSDRNDQGGKETVEQIISKKGQATFIKTDVSKYEEVKKLMHQIQEQFGRLDIAINNAGINGGRRALMDVPMNTVELVVKVNLLGVLLGTKVAMDIMKDQVR